MLLQILLRQQGYMGSLEEIKSKNLNFPQQMEVYR
ncbi:hypothetical protein J2Z26_000438 [Bacillus luteolus]|nr:hypothetical protein [Cytobacillus luteolus]